MNENQHIEWKRSWRDDYLKWICGFANADGGVLVIGKDDAGRAVGLANAERLLVEIPNKVRDLLGIMVDVNLKREGNKDLIEIVVEPYPYPISYRGEYHYRSGSTKQELKGAALDRFLLSKQGRHWDGVPAPGFGAVDLSSQALDLFRKQAANSGRLSGQLLDEPVDVLIDKLRLSEGDYLKRAAILLFGKDPERLITGAFVKIGFFRTNSDLLYHDEIHGNLFLQVEQTLDLLMTKYLRAGITYEGIQRVETFPVPEKALREAVINAIAHKDYAAATPIQISVYPDKLMIWNAGVLPEGWTIDALWAKHSSRPFNPDIANAFFRAAFLESWGRGIELITDACNEHGAPMPILRWQSGLWVEFPFPAKQIEAGEQAGGLTGEEWGEKWGEKWGPSALEKRRKIAETMMRNPRVTIIQLAKKLGMGTTAIENHLKVMREQGCIKRVGPAKGGRWEVGG